MVKTQIARELKRRKLSRYWLMNASGVPRTIIYEFLNGKRGIDLRHAEAMMKALNLKVVRSSAPEQ